MKQKEPKPDYAPPKDIESEKARLDKAKKYRQYIVKSNSASDEALIALFGCRGFHEIKEEAQ